MCFTAVINEKNHDDIILHSSVFLKERRAEGSDPGLCVAIEDQDTDKPSLMEFGRRATCSVLTKKEAYQLAEKLGIHLSEQGDRRRRYWRACRSWAPHDRQPRQIQGRISDTG